MVFRSPSQILGQVFGYDSFRGFQEQVIAAVLDGHDALVLMPTGGGKSLCYQIPALALGGVGVVVSPLIALMQDQVAALDEVGVRAAFLNSTLSGAEAAAVERRLRAGDIDLLYVAPERLLTERCQRLLDDLQRSPGLALFAIDEAHCVSQWGHDFRPEYLTLGNVARQIGGRLQTLALTATADAPTRGDIVEKLFPANPPRVFVRSFDRPNLRLAFQTKERSSRQVLAFVRAHEGESGIVYCA